MIPDRVYGLASVFVLLGNSMAHHCRETEVLCIKDFFNTSVDFSEILRSAYFWPSPNWNPTVKNEEGGPPNLILNGFKGTCFFKVL